MSYINNALRKVQKDKNSRYAAYDHIVSAPWQEPPRSRRRFILAGVALFLVFTAGLVTFLYFSSGQKESGRSARKINFPAQAAAVRQEPAQVAQASRPPATVKPAETKPQPQSPAVSEKITDGKIEKVVGKPQAAPAVNAGMQNIKKEEAPELKPAAAAKSPSDEPKKAAEKNKEEAAPLYAEALKKHQAGDLRAAKELYKKVIKEDPQNVQALNNLGVVYMKQGVYKWAAVRLQDALKIRPDYADAHYNLACVYAKTNDTRNSLRHLKDAAELNPEVKNWVKTDRDLESISTLPDYLKLMENR